MVAPLRFHGEGVEAMRESIRAGVGTSMIAVVPVFLLVGILSAGWEEMTDELAAMIFFGPLFLIIPLFFIVLGASDGLAAGVLAHLQEYPTGLSNDRARFARKLAVVGHLLYASVWIREMPYVDASGLLW